jgi:hypothetical protein
MQDYSDVEFDDGSVSFLPSRDRTLPFQPRRPPIPIQVIPDCYLVLSDIRLKMSFLLQFKALFEAETLVAERLRVLCSCLSLEWMAVHGRLGMLLMLCLLFRKPPDRLFEMKDFIIEVRTPRRRITRCCLWLLKLFLLLIGVCCWATTSAPQQAPLLPDCIESTGLQQSQDQDPLCGLSAAFLAEQYETSSPRDMGAWDSDAFPIVLDSGTSKSITPVFSDLKNPRPYVSDLQGVGKGRITHVGAISYEVVDDTGQTVTLDDAECYYCSDAPYRLFCPHSWKQQLTARGEPEGEHASFMTDPSSDSAYVLTWNRGKIVVTARLDTKLNLPILYGKSTYDSFRAFAGGFSSFPVMLDDGDSDHMPGDTGCDVPISKPPASHVSRQSRRVHFAHDVPTTIRPAPGQNQPALVLSPVIPNCS